MPHHSTPEQGPSKLILTGEALTPSAVEGIARGGAKVSISPAAAERMRASREVVERATGDGLPHYGINTGFGSLSRTRIAAEGLRDLQRNLVRSHAAGVGEPLERGVVRAMMVLLAASLARGRSGVRPELAGLVVEMLNRGVTPVVPEVGSVGASGDLAPLAHVALVLIGEGLAMTASSAAPMPGGDALRNAGLEPITLEAKEGLALINGTHLMAAQGALLCEDADRLVAAALCAGAMSIDACRGTDAFLDERVYAARNHPGPAAVAAAVRGLLEGSQIIPSHKDGDPRVQDPYSLRCMAPVMGAAVDALGYVKRAVGRELGAVTDNPLVFVERRSDEATKRRREEQNDIEPEVGGDIVSAGNFHGMPIAVPLDVMAIALAPMAGISERRVFWMLAATDPQNPTTAYLSPKPGLHSGLMIAQYTAAACCNEIIGLCTPASPANLSTSAGIEDYNSFGPRAAAKARRVVELAMNVVAIELLCASEALEYQRPLRSGEGVERAHAIVRSRVAKLTEDRPPAPDIAAVAALVREGAFSGVVTAVAG